MLSDNAERHRLPACKFPSSWLMLLSMRSPQDPGKRRRRRADVSPITGKVMLRPTGARAPKPTSEAQARSQARLAAILAAIPMKPTDKDG